MGAFKASYTTPCSTPTSYSILLTQHMYPSKDQFGIFNMTT